MFSDGWFYPINFLASSPIKLKLELQIDGGLLIANHLDQSLWLADKRQWESVDHIYYTPFCGWIDLLCPLQSTANCEILLSQTSAFFNFSSSNFIVQGQILSTCGDLGVIYFFPTLPIKLKLGLQIGGRLLIARHLDRPIRKRDQHTYLLPSTLESVRLFCTFYEPHKLCKNVGPKPFCWGSLVLTFLHPIFIWRVTYWTLVELLLGA